MTARGLAQALRRGTGEWAPAPCPCTSRSSPGECSSVPGAPSHAPQRGHFGIPPPNRKDPHASIALPGTAWWGLRPGFIPLPASHLRAAAALSAVGIGAAMRFELGSPNSLQGPVQALTTHNPEPRLPEEKPSQRCVVGKAAAKSHSNKEAICLFLDALSSDNERGAGKSPVIMCSAPTKRLLNR